MSDPDEKIVQVLARALAGHISEGWDKIPRDRIEQRTWRGPMGINTPSQSELLDGARDALAALRAANMEVVQWRPIAEDYQSKEPRPAGLVTFPRNGKTTHFAVLEGPKVRHV